MNNVKIELRTKCHFSPWTVQKLFLGVVFLLVMVVGAGCDDRSRQSSSAVVEDETITVVNNKKITLSQFQDRLNAFLIHYGDLVIIDEKRIAQLREIVINQLIDEEVLNQEAARKGIQVSDEELEEEIDNLVTQDGDQPFNVYFVGAEISEKDWRSRLRSHLIHKKLIDREVMQTIPVTKREINSYYQAHKDDFVIPSAYRVRNITLANHEEAEAVRTKILRGVNFTYLVGEHSISPDKEQNGDLGYIEKGDLPLEMETEIFRRENRQITDIIRSQDGYHILKLEKYRRRKRLSLNEARARIKQILVEQKKDELYQRWLDKLKENATISINQAVLNREQGF